MNMAFTWDTTEKREMRIQSYTIDCVDGPVRFRGRELARKTGRIAPTDGSPADVTVTVYSTPRGEGFIREDIAVDGQMLTFVHRIHAGTSPSWNDADEQPDETALLNDTWDLACDVDPALRPVRKWAITSDYEEFLIPLPDGTTLKVRSRVFPTH